MYCSKCGEQNADESKFCKNCGAALTQVVDTSRLTHEPRPPVIQQVDKTTRTSGLAIASLVLGILSVFFSPLGILAIIFGGVAISQTGKDTTLGGRGMAITGLVLGIVIIAIWIIAIVFWGAIFSTFL
jgi:hypothetical protein